MTGLEIENWVEKRGRTVRKFRSTRPRTESNFRFGLTSCRSQNRPTTVWSPVAPLVRYSTVFSRNLVKFTPCLTPPRIYPSRTRPKQASIQLGWRWIFLLRQEIFGRYMAILGEWMGKRCWPSDHQWSRDLAEGVPRTCTVWQRTLLWNT